MNFHSFMTGWKWIWYYIHILFFLSSELLDFFLFKKISSRKNLFWIMNRHSNVASSERRNGCDHGKKAVYQVFPILRNSEEMNGVLQIDNFHQKFRRLKVSQSSIWYGWTTGLRYDRPAVWLSNDYLDRLGIIRWDCGLLTCS